MISRLTCSALCCCTVLTPVCTIVLLAICSRPLIIHTARVEKPSQKSGIVPEHSFQYASCSGVGSTVEEEKQSKGERPMPIEENKELVRRFVEEFWNRGNTAAADELMTT